MEQLQLEQVIIIGVGAGANTAARVALAAPNKVNKFHVHQCQAQI